MNGCCQVLNGALQKKKMLVSKVDLVQQKILVEYLKPS